MIAYLIALTLVSWACLWPMLRAEPHFVAAPEPIFPAVPSATFDSRGFV